jgi:hypothetical protein
MPTSLTYPTRSEGLRLAPNGAPLQPLLFDALPPIREPNYDRGQTIQERFEAFDAANPHVREALRNLALRMQARGVRRYGMKGLFEVLRWRFAIQTEGDEYKLNNIFTSRYSRLLMETEPRLAGFFATRELLAE